MKKELINLFGTEKNPLLNLVIGQEVYAIKLQPQSDFSKELVNKLENHEALTENEVMFLERALDEYRLEEQSTAFFQNSFSSNEETTWKVK